MPRIGLYQVCQARSGDKGDSCNVAVFARTPAMYGVLLEQLTPARVKEHYGGWVKGEVRRYEVPNVLGLNFVLRESLGGGGASTLRSDNLGKSMASALLRMTIEVSEEVLRRDGGLIEGPVAATGV